MIRVIGNTRIAYDHPAIVNPHTPGVEVTERSEVSHAAIGKPIGMRLEVVSCISLSGNLVSIVNSVRSAPVAAYRAQRRHPSPAINEPEKVTDLVVGITYDDSAIVNIRSGTRISSQCAQVSHAAIRIKKC